MLTQVLHEYELSVNLTCTSSFYAGPVFMPTVYV